MNSKNILVIAAHPDDEILGCGGAIAKFSEQGCTAHFAILGEGIRSRKEEQGPSALNKISQLQKDAHSASRTVGAHSLEFFSFPDNQFDSVPLLDLIHCIEDLKKRLSPDVVFTHHPGDLNIDHLMTFRAVLTAFRPLPEEKPCSLISFEVPSSTEWQTREISQPFSPNFFVPLKETHLARTFHQTSQASG
jgi:LmbE family N-acetylglucosaminyl deacetylase